MQRRQQGNNELKYHQKQTRVIHCLSWPLLPEPCMNQLKCSLYPGPPLNTKRLHPPKFIRWNPNPHCDGIKRWGLWGWVGHEGRALINEMITLTKGTQESALAPPNRCGHSKMAVYEADPPSPDAESASSLILHFPASRTLKINICWLSHPICGTIVTAAWTNLREH